MRTFLFYLSPRGKVFKYLKGIEVGNVPASLPPFEEWWIVRAKSKERAEVILNKWPSLDSKQDERIVEHGIMDDPERANGQIYSILKDRPKIFTVSKSKARKVKVESDD